jgi:hypothetical protein
MATRKMHVTVEVDLYIVAEDYINLQNIIDEMDYNFNSNTDGVRIEDTFISDYNLTDSR